MTKLDGRLIDAAEAVVAEAQVQRDCEWSVALGLCRAEQPAAGKTLLDCVRKERDVLKEKLSRETQEQDRALKEAQAFFASRGEPEMIGSEHGVYKAVKDLELWIERVERERMVARDNYECASAERDIYRKKLEQAAPPSGFVLCERRSEVVAERDMEWRAALAKVLTGDEHGEQTSGGPVEWSAIAAARFDLVRHAERSRVDDQCRLDRDAAWVKVFERMFQRLGVSYQRPQLPETDLPGWVAAEVWRLMEPRVKKLTPAEVADGLQWVLDSHAAACGPCGDVAEFIRPAIEMLRKGGAK